MASPFPGSAIWPPSWPAATFRGQLIEIAGVVAGCRLAIAPNVNGLMTLAGAEQVIVPRWWEVTVSPDTGAFSVSIPATGVTGVNPPGWSWAGRIWWPTGEKFVFGFTAAADSVVQLRDAVGGAVTPPTTGGGGGEDIPGSNVFPLSFPVQF